MATKKPTLIMGIGGVGGRILKEVSKKLSEEDRKFIATICLDTNVLDLQKLEKSGIDYIVQTSTDQTVKDYCTALKENGNDPTGWIHNIPLMNERTMLKGAGQIRQLSRLAMLSSIESNKFKAIDEAIDRVNSAGQIMQQDVSVFIVGSIAGGTCAGSMVQLPLYVRERLIQHSAATDPNIRGLFIGPSVTESYQEGNTTKIRDTYANGYAVIKEINGFYRFASMDKNSIPVKLEYYEPKKEKDGNDTNPIPYKYLFLIEKYNHMGKPLPRGARPHDYEKMVANILLAQLSPIGAEAEGSEDNLIRGLISTEGMNRYCGAGAINIEYPYEDLKEYCAIRCSADSVQNQWRRIDEEYLLEKRSQAQRAQIDTMYVKEELEDFYIRKFEEYAAPGSTDAFFRSLSGELKQFGSSGKKQTGSSDTDDIFDFGDADAGENVTDKISIAKRAIENLIKSDSEENEDVLYTKTACRIEEGNITNPESGSEDSIVLRELRAIDDYLDAVKNNLQIGYDTVNKIISIASNDSAIGMTAPWVKDHSDYNIAHIIKGTHPIVARYILLKLREYAKIELEKAIESEQYLESNLDVISRTDFDGDDTNGIQNANTVYNNIINGKTKGGRLFKSVLSRKSATTPLDDFASLFVDAVRHQIDVINKYHIAAYRHRVFEDMVKRINILIEAYTIMFDSLPVVTKEISDKAQDLETAHEEENEDVSRYVFARKRHKKVAYNVITNLVSTEVLPDETKDKFAEEIYGLFASYYSKSLDADESEKDFYRDELDRKARTLFTSTMFPSIKHAVTNVINNYFDKGVVKALEYEVLCDAELAKFKNDFKGASSDFGRLIKTGDYQLDDSQINEIKDIIRMVMSRAEPFIGIDGNPTGKAVYWGTSNKTFTGGVTKPYLLGLLDVQPSIKARMVEDSTFTKNELVCYNVFYAINPEDLKNYQKDSASYKYYTQSINDVILKNKVGKSVESAASPHLDKRWHLEAFLPEIDPKSEIDNRRKDLIAMATLLASDGVAPVEYDGVKRWSYKVPIYPVDIHMCEKLAPCSYVGLFKSMSYNPIIKGSTLEELNQTINNDKDRETDIENNIENHFAIKMLYQVPDVLGTCSADKENVSILDIISEMSSSVSPEKYHEMLDGVKAFVLDYCKSVSSEREGQAEKLFKDVMRTICDKSSNETMSKQEFKRIGEL